MNKKFIVMAAFAAVFGMSFTACSNNDDDLAGGGNLGGGKTENVEDIINPTATVEGSAGVTRGFATTSANVLARITNFQTWAYDGVAGGIYMGVDAATGRTVTGDGAGAWSYTPQQFWPVNALNFVAITPNSPNGVTANAVAQDGTSKDITLTSSVTLSTNVEDQDDIMFAEKDGITKATANGDVPFVFKHALSQIVFKGKLPTSGAVTKVTIAEITLGNIGKTGDLTFTSKGAFFGGTNAYIATTANDNFTLDADDLEASVWDDEATGLNNATAGTAFDLTVSDNATKKNAWFMLPQRSAAWVNSDASELKAGGMASAPATGAYLKIRAQLEKDGVVILGNAASDAIYIPLDANWDRSKKYIYTIEFNGTSALTPITFSVTAQDWTDADPQPGEISM